MDVYPSRTVENRPNDHSGESDLFELCIRNIRVIGPRLSLKARHSSDVYEEGFRWRGVEESVLK